MIPFDSLRTDTEYCRLAASITTYNSRWATQHFFVCQMPSRECFFYRNGPTFQSNWTLRKYRKCTNILLGWWVAGYNPPIVGTVFLVARSHFTRWTNTTIWSQFCDYIGIFMFNYSNYTLIFHFPLFGTEFGFVRLVIFYFVDHYVWEIFVGFQPPKKQI